MDLIICESFGQEWCRRRIRVVKGVSGKEFQGYFIAIHEAYLLAEEEFIKLKELWIKLCLTNECAGFCHLANRRSHLNIATIKRNLF